MNLKTAVPFGSILSRALPTGVMIAVVSLSSAARAQDETLEDWPCVQRYISEILPATFWPIPIPEELVGSWRRDDDTAALARQLGEQESFDDATVAAMDRFAESWPASDREMALSRLADGIVDVADDRRALYLDGIRRYTRQQIAIAEQIEATLNQLGELDDADTLGITRDNSLVAAERTEIEETLAWHQRLYDQRERAIRSLCDRPVVLEQTLSEVLRELSYRLP